MMSVIDDKTCISLFASEDADLDGELNHEETIRFFNKVYEHSQIDAPNKNEPGPDDQQCLFS